MSRPENPYAAIGSPIPNLVAVDQLDRVLSEENLDFLVGLARVPAGELVFGSTRVPRTVWLRRAIRATVQGWLKDAHRPPVREVAAELRDLKRRLYEALEQFGDLAKAAAAARAYSGLSPAARSEIDRGGFLARPLPTVAAIRGGDAAALNLLFGLVPVRAAPPDESQLFGAAAPYAGSASGELHRTGRPPAVRLEQLIMEIGTSYKLATGRRLGRGDRTPFASLVRELIGFLTRGQANEIADQPLRRVVRRYNALCQQRKRRVRVSPTQPDRDLP
jgi:hypothetical protein